MTLKEKKEVKQFLDSRSNSFNSFAEAREKFNLTTDELSQVLADVGCYEAAQLKANLMSIGSVLFHFIEKTKNGVKFLPDDEYVRIGKEYCEFAQKGSSVSCSATRDILKSIMLWDNFYKNLAVIKFIVQWEFCSVSKVFKLNYNNACCKVTIHKEGTLIDSCEPIYVKDIAYYYDKFCVLDGLVSSSEDNGSELVRLLCKVIDIPIVLQAGFLFYGEYTLWNDNEYDFETIQELVEYYENMGFINVNDVIGNYENSVIMLYCGDAALKEKVISKQDSAKQELKSMGVF